MKNSTLKAGHGLLFFLLFSAAIGLRAQGTVFTYQGMLNFGAGPANGSYDMQFQLYNATTTNGNLVGSAVEAAGVAVSNGLFTVTLDFGPGVFGGSNLWMQIAARTNGGATFTNLAPLLPITPTPYAIYAGSAATASTAATAANLSGTVSNSSLSGSYNSAVTLNNPGNAFSGSFNGNGSGLTNLNLPTIDSAVGPVNSMNVAWGDSLTLGTGAPAGLDYPDQLASILKIPSLNEGVSGNTSTQILDRFLAASSTWGQPTLIWSGRNDSSTPSVVVNNVANMISRLTTTNWIVMSVINASDEGIGTTAYSNIVLTLNPALSNLAGSHFLDVRKFLVNCAILSNPQDYATYTNDIPAEHLRTSDGVHLNSYGYAEVVQNILQSGFNGMSNLVPTYGMLAAALNAFAASPPVIGFADPQEGYFSSLEIGSDTNFYFSLSGDGTALQCNPSSNVTAIIALPQMNLGTTTYPWSTIAANGPIYLGPSGTIQASVGISGDGSMALYSRNSNVVFVNENLGEPAYPCGTIYAANFVGSGAGLTNLPSSGAPTNGNNIWTAANTFTGALIASNDAAANYFAGTFAGNGASLSNLPSWGLTGNAGTTAGLNFIGTTDNQPLQIWARGMPVAIFDATADVDQPDVTLGSWKNAISNGVLAGTIAGGHDNTIAESPGGDADHSTIAGGNHNIILDTTTSVIGGGAYNAIEGSESEATIAGGGGNFITNSFDCVISGGDGNIIESAAEAVIAGGGANESGLANIILDGADDSVIGGGSGNSIGMNALGAVIGGGAFNSCQGNLDAIAGGCSNLTGGDFSFAAGYRAQATNTGAFVWADSQNTNFSSTNNDSFNVRAQGGVFFYVNNGGTAGAVLAAGQTSWTTLSDRNAKKNFQPVDTVAILDKLAAIPVQSWNYKWEKDSDVPHIGPMAQDFKHAFYPGRNDKGITTLEFDGVELAAIQGVNRKLEAEVKTKDTEIDALRKQIANTDACLEKLEKAVALLAGKDSLGLVAAKTRSGPGKNEPVSIQMAPW